MEWNPEKKGKVLHWDEEAEAIQGVKHKALIHDLFLFF